MEKDPIKYMIYYKPLDIWYEVSSEAYYEHFKKVWSKRAMARRLNECYCPKAFLYKCDGNCIDCEYYHSDNISIYSYCENSDIQIVETIEDESENIEEDYLRKKRDTILHNTIDAMPDNLSQIMNCALDSNSKMEVAELLSLDYMHVYRNSIIAEEIIREKMSEYYK